MQQRKLFALKEVAELLQVKPHRIHYLISVGQIKEPELKVAGKRLWNILEIEEIKKFLKTKDEHE